MSQMKQVEQFWVSARAQLDARLSGGEPSDVAPAVEMPLSWAFGATAEHADELLALVLSGIKTGTASAVWDYEADGEAIPQIGDLSIILDGEGVPRALIRTTSVDIVPFDQVTPAHAFSEGEGERTLAQWRADHERYWRNYMTSQRQFAADMPVLCERFELLYVQ